MKIFLDTAQLSAITKWIDTGLINGITTNPTTLSMAAGSEHPTELLKKICTLMKGSPVSIQVTATDPLHVYEQARQIAALAENVVVKIPCHLMYAATIKKLVAEGILINITLVFSVNQALAMCKLGVAYISPFIGRLDDMGINGMHVARDIRNLIDTYAFSTQLLVASIRNMEHMQQAVALGADCATIPPVLLEMLCKHPLTDLGMTRFAADWQKLDIESFP